MSEHDAEQKRPDMKAHTGSFHSHEVLEKAKLEK